jgi:Fe-S cluster assembly scaffold protein SufB
MVKFDNDTSYTIGTVLLLARAARSSIRTRARSAKGLIEHVGMLLDAKSRMDATPFLMSTAEEVELTHEAAIGGGTR